MPTWAGSVTNLYWIRSQTGVHLCVVHHTGKEVKRGSRGHSLLAAAADTIIVVEPDDAAQVSTGRVAKQRDLACEGEFTFGLETVEIGRSPDGPITSCVVVPARPGLKKQWVQSSIPTRRQCSPS